MLVAVEVPMLALLLACSTPEPPEAPPAAPEAPPGTTEPAERLPATTEPFPLPSPAGETPSLAADGDTLWLSWQERVEDGGRVRVARRVGGAWTDPVTVVESERLLVNWADHAAVHPDGRGGAYVHWLERQGGDSHGYDLVVAHSADGVTFRRLGSPHADGTPTEHGFVSVAADGAAHRLFWVDGRAMVSSGPSAIRSAPLTPEGFGAEEVVDDRACDCCATAAVATASGALVAYRDRSPEEVRDVRLARLGSAAPELPGAESWTIDGCPVNGPALDVRRGAGTPGTDRAGNASGRDGVAGEIVAAAWYTEAGGVRRVRAAVSSDGGIRFGSAVDVAVPAGTAPGGTTPGGTTPGGTTPGGTTPGGTTPGGTTPGGTAPGGTTPGGTTPGGTTPGAPAGATGGAEPLGRVDVAVAADGTALVVWLERRGDTADVLVRRIGADGAGAPRVVGRTSAQRGSGFPTLAESDGGWVVAWTVPGEPPRLEAVWFSDEVVPVAGRQGSE